MNTNALRLAGALSLAAVVAFVAGCAAPVATSADLTYQTSPIGATLYENGKPIGVEPVRRRYETGGKPGDITTPDVVAVWPSGVKSAPFFTYLTPGDDRNAVIERPKGAPNLEVDVAAAAKLAAERAKNQARDKEQQEADLARNSARCQAQRSGTAAVKSPIDECK